MEPVQFSDAVRMTGLSANQLREWCGKRALFRPTVQSRGSGRVALYTWQDLLALRVFHEVVGLFGGRASDWAGAINHFRTSLIGQSFPSLWGKAVVFNNHFSSLVVPRDKVDIEKSVLSIQLTDHLIVLSEFGTSLEVQGELPLVSPLRSGT
jgi:hypothetical protein